jgi:UDP-glucose 4-epimerase
VGLINIVDATLRTSRQYIVFSSSSATYGIPDSLPVQESAEQPPMLIHTARSKLAYERILIDVSLLWSASSVENVPTAIAARRAGDLPVLVADPARA